MKNKIVITRKIPKEALSLLEGTSEIFMWDYEDTDIPRDLFLKEMDDATALFTNVADTVDKELIDASPHLQVISTMAVGFDNIDIETATTRGIPVGHTPGVLSESTGEFTFALLMATARRIVNAADHVRNGKWKSWGPMVMAGQDVWGKTIGIIGMGRIGEEVAKRAKGFDMKILYHNPSRKPETEAKLGAIYMSLDALLQQSDYVVLLAPATEQTYKMMGEKEFAMMKPSSIFINTSRGKNVDEQALYQALKHHKIWAAGLDVFEVEPAKPDHPLLSLPNIVATPHIGSASIETRINMAKLAATNLLLGLEQKDLLHVVNPTYKNYR